MLQIRGVKGERCLGITKEIWEDRGIASLHRYYAPEIVVRAPASVVVGNAGVIVHDCAEEEEQAVSDAGRRQS